jgi:uncharacterized protein (DUF1778 family)
MTDDLVQRLKGHSEIMERDKGKVVRFIDVATCTEAADLIESQAAEIERLWEVVSFIDPAALTEAADLIEEQAAEIERLREALQDCADDLESEIEAKRGTVLERTTERDLGSVRKARAALAKAGGRP